MVTSECPPPTRKYPDPHVSLQSSDCPLLTERLLGLSGTQLVSGVWGLVTPNAHALSLQCAASCANPLCELRTGRSDCGGWSERAWTGNSRWDSGGQRQRGSVADSHVGGVSVTNPTPPPHLLRQHQRTQQSSWERQRPTSLPP